MDVEKLVQSFDFTAGLVEHLRGGNVVWAYALLAATTLPPLVPNAVLLVTGGVLAAQGRLDITLVLLVVALSALLGDMLIHRAGRAVSGRVVSRIHRRPRQVALLRWAALRIQRYGVPFVIAVRFLPSGRLVGGLAAGVVRYPARRYLAGAGVAEAVWATYSVGVGYVSGRAASNSLYAVGLGFGTSLLVAGAGMLAQWASRTRERHQLAVPFPAVLPAPAPAPATAVVAASASVRTPASVQPGPAPGAGPHQVPGTGGTPGIHPSDSSLKAGFCGSAGRGR
ncbi:VTT domain-containing protein [Streptomyces sp. H10-C2]|uniref:DedA family protein n=1 Tax=unclassified Streptomyces TaxID=2593676 RepID=UPI0024B91F43|nr:MULTISPECIES: VTT domain-containing protein [unclassified Streptomyces]MDJ0340056.1 VTT domain-containing protein [Streptomyces sp. PH10-H1]MDJ0369307.1 VTT domain-containing protein [Streptomyces sp. H10-C2]